MSIETKISKLAKELGLDTQQQFVFETSQELTDISVNLADYDANLFIGDNLVYLKELSKQQPETIDICYIDPPYNTGSKFLYNDNRKSEATGIFGTHSSWMSFMLPRLVTARDIMKKTGVIAISIDDYEHTYLKLLMDRVFGEENFIGNIVVCRSKNGKGSKKNIASNHEYLLIYGKSKEVKLRGQKDDTAYDKNDRFGDYRVDGLFRKKGEASLRSDRPNMFYPLYYNPESGEVSVDLIDGWKKVYPLDSKGIERRWLWGLETAKQRAWKLYASKGGVIYVKNYAGNDNEEKRIKIRTVWLEPSFYTERATNEITKLFGSKVFDTPKPIDYIKKIIDVCSDSDSLILDFFAGSGTTAQAMSELNSMDNGTRKCLLMEEDCEIPTNHSARLKGFSRVADITEQRLELIKKSNPSFKYHVTNFTD